jgi:hypothetical protein
MVPGIFLNFEHAALPTYAKIHNHFTGVGPAPSASIRYKWLEVYIDDLSFISWINM